MNAHKRDTHQKNIQMLCNKVKADKKKVKEKKFVSVIKDVFMSWRLESISLLFITLTFYYETNTPSVRNMSLLDMKFKKCKEKLV